jgi:hypothetical protein
MKFEQQPAHGQNRRSRLDTSASLEREVDPTDFYFEDPTLQFPLSPKSVHKKKGSVALAPSKRSFSDEHHGHHARRLFVPAIRQKIRNKLNKRKRAAATMSPGSEGTESTAISSSRSMYDDGYDIDDGASFCGSLTYSIESVDMAYMIDDDGQVVRRPSQEQKCFELFDVVVTAVKKIFEPNSERQQGHTAYFEFDAEVLMTHTHGTDKEDC